MSPPCQFFQPLLLSPQLGHQKVSAFSLSEYLSDQTKGISFLLVQTDASFNGEGGAAVQLERWIDRTNF